MVKFGLIHSEEIEETTKIIVKVLQKTGEITPDLKDAGEEARKTYTRRAFDAKVLLCNVLFMIRSTHTSFSLFLFSVVCCLILTLNKLARWM
jgi:uncharacterized protein YhbP (UPF0306 family)